MKAKHLIISLCLILCSGMASSQVGIGTVTPNPSSILDLTATDKALLLPRVYDTSAIASPIDGMVVYDISTQCVKGYVNGAWTGCGFIILDLVLQQIGLEADQPNQLYSVVTASQLDSIAGVVGVDPANEAAYQTYIDANPTLFSSPATVAEVNAMVTEVNAN